jgi:hypothetical protein
MKQLRTLGLALILFPKLTVPLSGQTLRKEKFRDVMSLRRRLLFGSALQAPVSGRQMPSPYRRGISTLNPPTRWASQVQYVFDREAGMLHY